MGCKRSLPLLKIRALDANSANKERPASEVFYAKLM
jgi:hypothetical protein